MTNHMPLKADTRLINAFVRSRRTSKEFTTKTDLLCYGALLLSGTETEQKAGERSIRASMKYVGIPFRSQNYIVKRFRSWKKNETASYLRTLKPHTEVREMLEEYKS